MLALKKMSKMVLVISLCQLSISRKSAGGDLSIKKLEDLQDCCNMSNKGFLHLLDKFNLVLNSLPLKTIFNPMLYLLLKGIWIFI